MFETTVIYLVLIILIVTATFAGTLLALRFWHGPREKKPIIRRPDVKRAIRMKPVRYRERNHPCEN